MNYKKLNIKNLLIVSSTVALFINSINASDLKSTEDSNPFKSERIKDIDNSNLKIKKKKNLNKNLYQQDLNDFEKNSKKNELKYQKRKLSNVSSNSYYSDNSPEEQEWNNDSDYYKNLENSTDYKKQHKQSEKFTLNKYSDNKDNDYYEKPKYRKVNVGSESDSSDYYEMQEDDELQEDMGFGVQRYIGPGPCKKSNNDCIGKDCDKNKPTFRSYVFSSSSSMISNGKDTWVKQQKYGMAEDSNKKQEMKEYSKGNSISGVVNTDYRDRILNKDTKKKVETHDKWKEDFKDFISGRHNNRKRLQSDSDVKNKKYLDYKNTYKYKLPDKKYYNDDNKVKTYKTSYKNASDKDESIL